MPVFFATLYVNDPLPRPLPGFVIVIHVALLTAVQEQLPEVVTVTVPGPPAAAKLLLVGDIEQLQSVVALAGSEWADSPPAL